jgi:hypothetical protein
MIEIRDATVDDLDQVLALNVTLMHMRLQYDAYYQLHRQSCEVYAEYFRKLIDGDNTRVLVAIDDEAMSPSLYA